MSVDMDHVPGFGAGRAEELRLALAMRGGVSLAIWMGGACREIERLRSALDRARTDATGDADTDTDVYRALLVAAGYDNVVVDVLAGTSAGGLNAVLLACSLVYGMPFDDGIRDLWLKVADIEGLSRHPRDRTPPSLLRGDGVFYAQLMANLRDLLRRWEGQTEKRRVDLILTCTLLEPEADTVYQPVGAPIRDARSRAHFRFRHFGDDPAGASDFRPPDPPDSPPDPEEARWEPLRRLAYAARSTSSYPTAFEPARIRVGHGEDGSRNPEGRERFPRNMHGMFSESRSPRSQPGGTPIHPVTLVDGGVLDNIPIAWAIRSIAAAKASTAVDRWLLYLQPVPPREPLLEHQPARDADDCGRRRHGTDAWFPRLVGTARKALGIKLASESLLDDVGELRMHAVRAEQHRQLADTIAASSSSFAGLVDRAANQQALKAYRRRQGRVEAARLARLLEDPVQVTGPDPLPFGEPRHPLESMGPDRATAFLAVLHADDEAREHLPSPDLGALALPVPHTHARTDLFELRGELRSLHALARAVATLLDLANRLGHHRLEHGQDGEQTSTQAGRLAADSLYPLRSVIELLIAAHDRLLLRRCAQIRSGAADTPIDLAKQAAAELIHLVETIKLADRLTERDPLMRLCREVARDCPVMLADDADWPRGGFDWLWERLGKVTVELARAVPPQWSEYAYLRDATKAKDPGSAAITALVALEVLFGPLRADPLSESASIHFHMVSAANRSPLDGEIFDGDPPGDRSEKLAGNQLNNFAAFISARWRHNDWTWGRLDAACSLVELLTRPERMRLETLQRLVEDLKAPAAGDNRRAQVDAVVELLHRQILADEVPVLACLGDDRPSGFPEDPRAGSSVLGRIARETIRDRLPSRRRPAVRIGLVAWRALQPSGSGVFARVVRLVLSVGKPLAIPLLVAVLAPLLTLLAATAWFAAVTLLSGPHRTWGHLPVVLVALVAVTAWGSDRLRDGLRRLPRWIPRPVRCAPRWAPGLVLLIVVGVSVVAWYLGTDPPSNPRGRDQLGWLDRWTAVLVASGSVLAVAWLGRSRLLLATVLVVLLTMWGGQAGWLPSWLAVAVITGASLAVGLLGGWRLAALGLGAAALVLPFALVREWPFEWLGRLDGLLFVYAELSLLVAFLTYLFPLGGDRQPGRDDA